jgi:hypothetical protein
MKKFLLFLFLTVSAVKADEVHTLVVDTNCRAWGFEVYPQDEQRVYVVPEEYSGDKYQLEIIGDGELRYVFYFMEHGVGFVGSTEKTVVVNGSDKNITVTYTCKGEEYAKI